MWYDVDIQITKLVRGKGIYKNMVSSQESNEDVSLILIERQEIGDENPRSWMNDMMALLSRNGHKLKEDSSNCSKFLKP